MQLSLQRLNKSIVELRFWALGTGRNTLASIEYLQLQKFATHTTHSIIPVYPQGANPVPSPLPGGWGSS